MKKDRGAILIIALFIIAILLASGAVVLKMTVSENKSVKLFYYRKAALYIAEAGIEKAKTFIMKNPDWYTDISYDDSDDASWLMNESEGYSEDFGDGSFKIVKENGENVIYSIGYYMRSGQKSASVIIKIEYLPKPFKLLHWEII